jgi:MFS family permease
LIIAVSAVVTGFTDHVWVIAVLRFVSGMGFALIFSPGLVLMSQHFPRDAQGFGVGLFVGSFTLSWSQSLSGQFSQES